MKGTIPIIMCDSEDGCDEWLIDHYEMGATNWADLLEGWQYNPRDPMETAYCPKHKDQEGGGE